MVSVAIATVCEKKFHEFLVSFWDRNLKIIE